MNRFLGLQTQLETHRPKGSGKKVQAGSRFSLEKTSRYSYQKTPALFGIAGLTAVEAAELGLSAVGLVSPALTKSGNLSISSDKAQRLLNAQARQKLNSTGKTTYTYPVLWVNFDRPLGEFADALIEVTWEGNNYGE